MACYKPMIRAEDLGKWETAQDGHKYHPAKIFSTDRLEEFYRPDFRSNYRYSQINCGNCIGCRLDNSRDWANRGYLESLYWKNNYFVTLTYDDNHLQIPEEITTTQDITYTELEENDWKGILVPDDFRRFLNTFRKIMKREYNKDNIRFIGCGEYGSETARPHYHIILFNCDLPVESFYKPRISEGEDIYYQNKIIERAWTKGISNISEANWNNIAYVARYITKKKNGDKSEDYYAAKGQIKEFFRSSTKPGIGRQYYENHKKEIYKNDQILIRNKKGSHWVKPPKYFDRLYEKESPDNMKEIKQKRRIDNVNRLIVKGQTTSLTAWEQLQIEQETKETQTKSLRRNIIERGRR